MRRLLLTRLLSAPATAPRRTALLPAMLTALLLLAGSQSAQAYSFDLTALNIPGYAGPYVNVDIQLASATEADVTFTSLTSGGNSFLLLDGSSAALNVNSSSFSVGSLSATQLPGFNVPTLTTANPPGTSQVDGWGSFNLVIDSSDGYASASNIIAFTITRTDAGSWASAADVLALNSDGYAAAAHIGVCEAPCDKDAGAIATGFAAVPEPATAALLGLGLTALASAGRKRRSAH